MVDVEIGSPRIQRLANGVAAGDAGALEEFWREVEATGTPVVEPIEGDEGTLCERKEKT